MAHDLGDGVILHDRAEWAGTGHRPGNGDPRTPEDLTEFFAHHSGGLTLGDPDPAQWIRNIFEYHTKVKGYVDIAYEMLSDERGHLWLGRSSDICSAATFHHNRSGYACCLLRSKGDTEGDPVPAKVKVAFRKAYAVANAFAPHDLVARSHRDVFPTDCAGDDLTQFLHNGEILKGFKSGTPVPLPPSRPWPPWPGIFLRKGSVGLYVAQWQGRLVHRFDATVGVDGKFGPATATWTRRFQEAHDLEQDGIVGPRTWAAAG